MCVFVGAIIAYKNIEVRMKKIFVLICEDKHKNKVRSRLWAHS
jgi:hypothetical protein